MANRGKRERIRPLTIPMPDSLWRTLKVFAAKEGKGTAAYVRELLIRHAERRTASERQQEGNPTNA